MSKATELEDTVREVLFEYGSTNKNLNLGEAKDKILKAIDNYTEARLSEVYKKGYIAGGIFAVEQQSNEN